MENVEKTKKQFDLIASEMGYELVELTNLRLGGRTVIRAFIHRNNGNINLSDCKKYSMKISEYLDTEDIIKGKYTLEISSVGLDKPLLMLKDFKRRIGETVSVELKPDGHPKYTVEGKLLETDESGITLLIDDKKSHFEFDRIIKGKIVF
ncbi:MAG: ribosome maturation factor RimP [candidate division Zixibacteria bacterium]|nr:ribosome maturation factor RimP [candidate division Zixibacteria bacterium]